MPELRRKTIPSAPLPVGKPNRIPLNAPLDTASDVAQVVEQLPNLPNQFAEASNVPAMGSFTATQSKYYSGQVVDKVSGTHYDADSGRPSPAPAFISAARQARLADIARAKSSLSGHRLWFGIVHLALLAILAVLAYASRQVGIITLVSISVLSGIVMPVLKAVPWADEDADDVAFFVSATVISSLCMICSPALALALYFTYALIRQSANPAVFGFLIISFTSRIVFELSISNFSYELFRPFAGHFKLDAVLLNLTALLPMVGWYLAGVFHKLNE